jgi:hypothetical protein
METQFDLVTYILCNFRMADTRTAVPGDKRVLKDSDESSPGTSVKQPKMSSNHPSKKDPLMEEDPQPRSYRVQPGVARNPGAGMDLTAVLGLAQPYRITEMQFVTVNTIDYAGYFRSVYQAIASMIYPDWEDGAPMIITEDEFILVSRYILKQRIDQVYSTVTGRRPQGRVPVARAYQIPACYAVPFNGIGMMNVLSGSYLVVPQPTDPPVDPAQRLQNVVTFQMLERFTRYITTAQLRGFIHLSTLSMAHEGTGWWLISARTVPNANIVAGPVATRVNVRSVFPEFTPSDAFMCAIIRNGFNGQFANQTIVAWAIETISHVPSLLVQFVSKCEA